MSAGTDKTVYATPYEPKTPLGQQLMALREKAIAEGMVTLSADEILAITWTTSCPCPALTEDCVVVRRELVREMVGAIEKMAVEGWQLGIKYKIFDSPEFQKIMEEPK